MTFMGWRVPERIQRLLTQTGQVEEREGVTVVRTEVGQDGYLIYGPRMPLRPGRYRVTFELGGVAGDLPPSEAVATIDVHGAEKNRLLARRSALAGELSGDKLNRYTLDFEVKDEIEFNVQFRICSNGKAALTAKRGVELEEEVGTMG